MTPPETVTEFIFDGLLKKFSETIPPVLEIIKVAILAQQNLSRNIMNFIISENTRINDCLKDIRFDASKSLAGIDVCGNREYSVGTDQHGPTKVSNNDDHRPIIQSGKHFY